MPDLSLLEPLCELLGITLHEFMYGETILPEDLQKKSDEVLRDVLTVWLGQDRWEQKDISEKADSILKLKNVTKAYPTANSAAPAVDRVTFEIAEGEFTGIMGASGSGKTTLLNMIAAIDQPTEGSIEIEGQDIVRLSGRELARFRRERMGFVFQEYNLLETLTIYENIALALTIRETPKEDVERIIRGLAEQFDISDILDQFPYEVSGGQRQRCASARAIAVRPGLMLADEPTGALDSRSAKQLLDTFVMLRRKYGTTILMVTHDAISASCCDRILFMQDGRIRADMRRERESKQDFFRRILEVMAQNAGEEGYVS